MTASFQPHTTLRFFVPIDPRTCEPVEKESAFLELFAGALASVVLGGLGLEALAHANDLADNLGALQSALRVQITPQATTRAINAWRRKPTPFAPGVTPGVWVPASVPTSTLAYELQRLGVVPATGCVKRGIVASVEVPWRVVDRSRPANRPRPRW
jgi:hypothetical protein